MCRPRSVSIRIAWKTMGSTETREQNDCRLRQKLLPCPYIAILRCYSPLRTAGHLRSRVLEWSESVVCFVSSREPRAATPPAEKALLAQRAQTVDDRLADVDRHARGLHSRETWKSMAPREPCRERNLAIENNRDTLETRCDRQREAATLLVGDIQRR